jgi:DNA-binding response OmpR family regulator
MASKKKVLIVEDDQIISSMYKTRLEQDGFIVLVAANGLEGLEVARKEKPNLIMLDVILPQLDGFSVLQELKKKTPAKKTPVIMLTNLGTEEDKAKGEKLGATDYLVKADLTPAQVSKIIKKHIK